MYISSNVSLLHQRSSTSSPLSSRTGQRPLESLSLSRSLLHFIILLFRLGCFPHVCPLHSSSMMRPILPLYGKGIWLVCIGMLHRFFSLTLPFHKSRSTSTWRLSFFFLSLFIIRVVCPNYCYTFFAYFCVVFCYIPFILTYIYTQYI